MALMERVATLLRANVNDLLDRAEDPEKMLKQIVLDMENQLLQLKTQVAMALADGHLLEKKAREQEAGLADWHRRAELAVSKGDDALARAALERALTQERILAAFQAQVADQAVESEALRSTYTRLGGKLAETRVQCDLLVAQHRRTQIAARATEAREVLEQGTSSLPHAGTIGRMRSRIDRTEAENQAAQALLPGETQQAMGSIEDRFEAMGREDRVERMLAELKSKQTRMLSAG